MSALTLATGTLADQATALIASMGKLQLAAANVTELLEQAGYAGMRGDTADDLRTALAIHGHIVHQFNVTIRTCAGTATYCTCASNSASAVEAALEHQGDTPCGITVTPAEPDRPSLAAAHRTLGVKQSLDDALENPALGRALRSYARKHPIRRQPATDFKSLAANDRD